MEKILFTTILATLFFITGKAVTRSGEVNEGTIPTPRFSRDSSTWKPPSHAQEFTRKITILPKIITVLTRCSSIVFELI